VPLAECLGTFFLAPPQPACPRPAVTPTEAVLDQLPGIAVTVRGHELVELLRPAYSALAEQP
jgi:hypothetical protein